MEPGVTIKLLVIDEHSAEDYHKADYLANQCEARTKEQLFFRNNNPTFKCYVALIDNIIIGSLSSWQINDQRFTTEDILYFQPIEEEALLKVC